MKLLLCFISFCQKFRNAHIGLFLGRPFRASFPRRFALPFFKGGARRARDSNHSFQYFKQKDLLLKVAGLFFHLKLSSKDSNLDRQNQNLQCCHYTTRHHSFPNAAAKVQLIF